MGTESLSLNLKILFPKLYSKKAKSGSSETWKVSRVGEKSPVLRTLGPADEGLQDPTGDWQSVISEEW